MAFSFCTTIDQHQPIRGWKPFRYRNMYPTATNVPVSRKYRINGRTRVGYADDTGFSTKRELDPNVLETMISISCPGLIVPRNAGGVPINTMSGAIPEYEAISSYSTVETYACRDFPKRLLWSTLCARGRSGSMIARTCKRLPSTLNQLAEERPELTFQVEQNDSTERVGYQNSPLQHQ